MKAFNISKSLFFVVFFVCSNLNVHSGNESLINDQITIKLDTAGTLPDKIDTNIIYKITNLKIIGKINGTDVRLIREMGGSSYYDDRPTQGKLSILDLSQAIIISGGKNYYYRPGEGWSDPTYYNTESYEIGTKFFSNCKSLTNIILPNNGVTKISFNAFYGCSSLTNINIPNSVTEIGYSAFEGCSSLTNINIPNSVTSIQVSAFKGCSSLTNINIPNSVTSIRESAFEGCSSLTNINIPNSVESIWESAFRGCCSLASFHLPTKIRGVGNYAFEGCDNLTSMYVNWANFDDLAYYLERNEDDLTECFDFFKSWDNNGKSCTLFVPKGSYYFWTRNRYLHYFILKFKNIKEYDVTEISHVKNSNNTKEIFRYSIDGKLLKAPTKGINIVKYSNGTVKKIIVQ